MGSQADRRIKVAKAEAEAERQRADALKRELEEIRRHTAVEYNVLKTQFSNLEPLIGALWWFALVSDPLIGKDLNPDTIPGRTQPGSRLEGAGTHSARMRQVWANRQVGQLAEKLHRDLENRDQAKPKRPRCRRSDCRLKDRRQDVDATFCKACGEPLTEAETEAA